MKNVSIVILIIISSSINGNAQRFALQSIEGFISNYDPDYSVNDSKNSFLFGFHISTGISISSRFHVQTDLAMIDFQQSSKLNLIAIRPYYRTDKWLVGLSYGFGQLSIFESHSLVFNFEKYDNDLLSVVGSIFYEIKNLDNNQFAAEMFLCIYPWDNMMIKSGVSMAEDQVKQTDIDLLSTIEWKPKIRKSGLSIYGQWGGNNIQQTSVGLKYYFDSFNQTLKEYHRCSGFYSSRFK